MSESTRGRTGSFFFHLSSVWAVAAALLLCAPAKSGVVMMLEQVGSNLVGTASGSIDTAALTSNSDANYTALVWASQGILVQGNLVSLEFGYSGISGPANFGSGGSFFAGSSTGDVIGLDGGGGSGGSVFLPPGYVSGTLLSGGATWDNTTLSGLGVIAGVYKWTWGSGQHADSLTLYAGVPAPTAPEPGSVLLMGLGIAGIAVIAKRRMKDAVTIVRVDDWH